MWSILAFHRSPYRLSADRNGKLVYHPTQAELPPWDTQLSKAGSRTAFQQHTITRTIVQVTFHAEGTKIFHL